MTLFYYGQTGYGQVHESYNTGQLTEKDEYDYGTTCPTSMPKSAPSASLLRQTLITHDDLATPVYQDPDNPNRPSILDRTSSVTVYSGGAQTSQAQFTYDGTGVQSTSGVTEHDYANYTSFNNNRGNATSKTQWLNAGGSSPVTTYTYDDTGQMLSRKDPNGNTTQYSYADNFTTGSPPGPTNAYLTKITYPVTQTSNPNHVESFSYNYPDGQLSSSIDQNQQKTSYSYADPLGRLTEMDYPDGGKTTLSYNDTPNAVSVTTTEELNSTTNLVKTQFLDGVGQVTRGQLTSDPAGADNTDTKYDGLGRAFTVTNPYRSTSDPTYGVATNTYDALGRATLVHRPDGNTATTAYSGNCATVTDEQGKARKSCTDGLGRITQVFEDPSGLNYETDYQYDALDNLTKVTEGGQTRTFLFDSLSRLTSATNPESGTTTYSYDGNGNLISRVAPAPNQTGSATVTTTYQYDPLNRLTQKSYSDGTPTALFGYDEGSITIGTTHYNAQFSVGRPSWSYVQYSNGPVMNAYNYDRMGRIIGYYQRTPSSSGPAWVASYTYDLAGDVTSWTHPAGFTVYNIINTAGQVSSSTTSYSPTDTTHPQNLIPAITYTPFGAIHTLQEGCAPSASCPTSQQALETYDYNNRLQPVRMQVGNTSNSAADYCLVYNYYAGVGNPSSCAIPSQSTSGNNGNVMGYVYLDNQTTLSPSLGHTASYGYDSLNRLTSAVATGSSTYNLTFVYNNDGSGRYGNMSCQTNGQTQGLCTNVSFNPANNRITTPGYAYDAAGNLTQDPTWMPTANYTWDAEGRLTKITQGSNTYSNNIYNAQGWGVETFWPIYGNMVQDNVYDPQGRELGHDNAANGNWYDEDIWAAGQMMAQSFPSEMYFLHHNTLGTDVQLTNHAGAPTLDMLYQPWGQLLTHTGYESDAHYAGFQQAGGNLDATPTRQYANPLGRWTTPDPGGRSVVHLDDPQTWNMYAYVRNNPTTLTDPSGLYIANCNNDVKKCSKQISNFDKSLHQALKSKNEDIRKAAEAYGALGEKNGVNVTFVNQVDPKHSDVVGTVTAQAGTGGATYDENTKTFQQATQVTIKAGLGGSELEETALHEGAHVGDRAAIVNAINLGMGSFNRSLNITSRQSEINAYGVENIFRRSIGLPTLNIQDILAHPPYSDNPNIDKPLFPDLPGPE